MSKPEKVLIVGAGSMGRALALGIKGKGATASSLDLQIYDVHSDRAEALSIEAGAKVNNDLSQADVVVLCIKPHDLKNLAEGLAAPISKNALVISFLAGTTMTEVSDTLSFKGSVVRAMPNICAKVAMAATGASHNGACSGSHIKSAEKILSSVGNLHWLKEELMDAVTGLSGSGPAYVFMVVEAMTDGGVKMGLPRDVAYSLSLQTVAGAASLLQDSGLHPAILKDQVTTPGGTTINGLYELEAHGLRPMLIRAIETATKRSKDLRRPPEQREMD